MNKALIDKILVMTGQALSYLWPSCIPKAFHSIRDKLYTGYIRRRFAHCGSSFFLWRPYNLKGTECINIGDDNIFEAGLQLTAWEAGGQKPKITIGNGCIIRRDNHITACESITIGNHLLTGTNVLITDNTHGDTCQEALLIPPAQRDVISKGPVIIGNNVWLGNNVCVLPGVTIGDGAVVGANSVVTHDIPAYCVAAGIPAKVIKTAAARSENIKKI